MRGADYVVKRVVFALVTIFIAITLNFILFRLAPGDAVTNLSRVPHATPETRAGAARKSSVSTSRSSPSTAST